MTTTVQEIAPQILEKIKKAKSILLHCHPSPDPDSVGSALAMKFAVESLGKKVTVIGGDSAIPTAFNFPGVHDIVAKNYFEIDTAEFDLFIIQDSSALGMIARNGDVVFPSTMDTIVIDHHISNQKYANLNLVDPAYPATAQILFDLFSLWGVTLTHDIALNLMLGMYTDTGGFRYGGTTAATLMAAATCIQLAPDYSDVIFTMENSSTPESLMFQGLALNSIETFLDGHLAIAVVQYKDLKAKNINVEGGMHTSIISNLIKSVVGWNVGVCVIEEREGEFKLSLRTRDAQKYNLSEVAVMLGGGGHRAAAGAVMKGDVDEVKKKIVTAVASVIK